LVTGSVVANNGYGITGTGATAIRPNTLTVQNTLVAYNRGFDGGFGVSAIGPGAIVRVARSTITGNEIGWGVDSSFGGTLSSYGDNNVGGNTTDGAPTSTIGLK
jgi:hypothetical protein